MKELTGTTKDFMNQLAQVCGETIGATFTITFGKDRNWKVSFPNTSKIKQQAHTEIDVVLRNAIYEVMKERLALEAETKYTLY